MSVGDCESVTFSSKCWHPSMDYMSRFKVETNFEGMLGDTKY